MKQNS